MGYVEDMEERLASWERELDTNEHGLACLAGRAIRVLASDIAHAKTGEWPQNANQHAQRRHFFMRVLDWVFGRTALVR